MTFPDGMYIVSGMADIRQISTIFFDLDGTLLPIDEKRFMQEYLVRFLEKCRKEQIDPAQAQQALMAGVHAMRSEDGGGAQSNKDRFWSTFFAHLSVEKEESLIAAFNRFYHEEFTELGTLIEPFPLARKIVDTLKEKGYTLVLATSPLFPRAGTLERLSWIGLSENDFEFITTYEDYSYTKPHIGYYDQVFSDAQVDPNEVLMVGNNVVEDGAIRALGAQVIFVTDYLINPLEEDISSHPCYTLDEFYDVCRKFPRREQAGGAR